MLLAFGRCSPVRLHVSPSAATKPEPVRAENGFRTCVLSSYGRAATAARPRFSSVPSRCCSAFPTPSPSITPTPKHLKALDSTLEHEPRLLRDSTSSLNTLTTVYLYPLRANKMPERTPLLLLLDGILSQSEERAQPPLVEITRLLRESDVHLILPHPDISLTRSAANLLAVLEALLSVQPELVSFPSQRDGSLPLHFAASLGNVQVASLLLGKVCSLKSLCAMIMMCTCMLSSVSCV